MRRAFLEKRAKLVGVALNRLVYPLKRQRHMHGLTGQDRDYRRVPEEV